MLEDQDIDLPLGEHPFEATQYQVLDGESLCLVYRQGVARHHWQLQEHGLAAYARDRFLARHDVHVINVWEHLPLAQRSLLSEACQQTWVGRW